MMSDTPVLRGATFFRKLRALCRSMRKTQWRVEHHAEFGLRALIRCDEDSCPLTWTWYVASNQYYEARDFDAAGRKLGFSTDQIDSIVVAADKSKPYDPQLRRILLKAAGLA